MNYKKLGLLLKSARQNSNMSQQDVAKRLGLTFQNISSWERGKSKIDIESLYNICKIYNINFIDVLKATAEENLENNPELSPVEKDLGFSEQLKKLMAQKNMKAVDLARAAGLSEAAISDYLKGKKEPRGRQSIAIAKALDVSLDTLWETGFDDGKIPFDGGKEGTKQKKSPESVAGDSGEERKVELANELYETMLKLGIVKEGAELTERQAELLRGIILIIKAGFQSGK